MNPPGGIKEKTAEVYTAARTRKPSPQHSNFRPACRESTLSAESPAFRQIKNLKSTIIIRQSITPPHPADSPLPPPQPGISARSDHPQTKAPSRPDILP